MITAQLTSSPSRTTSRQAACGRGSSPTSSSWSALRFESPFRRSTIAFELVRCGIDHARRKGFRRIYGHSRQGLESFWSRFGAKPIPGREEFLFSDHLYTEMTIELEPTEDAISLKEGPMMILRPEGDWDREGILEFSRTRAARSVSDNSIRATQKPKNAA